jgi:hypothetical protein
MINKLFWDIDETLIHTLFNEKTTQPHISFKLPNDTATYNTIVRDCAQSVIDFSREIVGAENVYILTAATHDYAWTINNRTGWGFGEHQIIARDEIARHKTSTAYGGSCVLAGMFAHRDNILIDNLPWRYNTDKMSLIGIRQDRYVKIEDYYGVDFEGCNFEEYVKEAIVSAHKEKAFSETNHYEIQD